MNCEELLWVTITIIQVNDVHLLLHRCGIVALWMASSALIKSKTRCNEDEEITNNCSGIFISAIFIKLLSVRY